MGNRCQQREVSLLIAEDDGGEEKEVAATEEEAAPAEIEVNIIEISLNSVVGLCNPKTMKMVGRIGDFEVIVMIDPGANHNFISGDTVAKLVLGIEKGAEFGVTLGNGTAVQGSGKCTGVHLETQGVTVVEEFLILSLGNSDLILEVS